MIPLHQKKECSKWCGNLEIKSNKSRLQNLEKATPPVIKTKYGTIIGKNVKISTPNQDLDPVTQVNYFCLKITQIRRFLVTRQAKADLHSQTLSLKILFLKFSSFDDRTTW